jgi:hypothetical protein
VAPPQEIIMETRDLWEEQVNRITYQCRELLSKIEDIEERMNYFENVMLTLIVSLKNAGIIQPDPEGEYSIE